MNNVVSIEASNEGKILSNVVSKKALRKQQRLIINHLDEVISQTYGPMNSNTEIIKGQPNNIYTEFTKDGHTVMKGVLYTDPIAIAIHKEMEEITYYTERRVGDGTSTATKMSAAIFNRLCDGEEDGTLNESPYVIINKFQKVVEDIKAEILKNGRECTLEDIYNIALISTNGNTKVADIMHSVYKKYGNNVFIDVTTSNDENTYEKEYDGMSMEIGYSDPAYINTDKGNAEIHDAKIYAFIDPIDTPEMVSFMEAIINENIYKPLFDPDYTVRGIECIPTVIIAPKISRDVKGLMKKLIDYMNQYGENDISQKPPLLIITNIGPYMDDYVNIATLCGCKFIQKVIDPQIQAQQQESGNEPTLDNITEWCGTCKLVSSDSLFTKFEEPGDMYTTNENGEREYSVTYKNRLAFLQASLDDAIRNGEDNNVTGRLKRQINSMNENLVEIFVGGIEVADRDSLRCLVEDAVLSCRSASKHGVGYAANYEGFKACNKIAKMIDEGKMEYDKLMISLLVIIGQSYRETIKYLYSTMYTSKEVEKIMDTIIHKDRGPYNLSTGEYDGKVLTSIDTDSTILDAIAKIVMVMYSANQALVPSPTQAALYSE